MKELKKIYNQLQKTEIIYSDNYVISQTEEDLTKWEIMNKTIKYFLEECKKNGISHLEILLGKKTEKGEKK